MDRTYNLTITDYELRSVLRHLQVSREYYYTALESLGYDSNISSSAILETNIQQIDIFLEFINNALNGNKNK